MLHHGNLFEEKRSKEKKVLHARPWLALEFVGGEDDEAEECSRPEVFR